MITRRALLCSTAAVALTGCGTNPNGQVPSWVAAMQAILTEMSSVIPQLQNVGLSGGTLTKVQAIIAEIKTALSAINAASTSSQGASTLATIETYINSLAPLILPFVTLVPGGTIIGMIVAALPAIELVLNFLVSLLSPAAQQVAATAPPLPASRRRMGSVLFAPGVAQQYLVMLEQQAAVSRRYRKH